MFLNAEEQGGGPLVDIGTHALDLTLWTMDNYKPKYEMCIRDRKNRAGESTAWCRGDWRKMTICSGRLGRSDGAWDIHIPAQKRCV